MAEEANKAPEGEAATAAPKPKTGLSKIILAVLGLSNLVLIALVVLGPGGEAPAEAAAAEEEAAPEALPAPPPSEGGPVQALDPFIVNLADTDMSRYLRVSIGIQFRENVEAPESILEPVLPALRDRFISTLGSQQSRLIRTPEQKDALKAELITVAEDIIGTRRIANLYFTEFIVQ
jgi:flagellar FliL protein